MAIDIELRDGEGMLRMFKFDETHEGWHGYFSIIWWPDAEDVCINCGTRTFDMNTIADRDKMIEIRDAINKLLDQ